MWWIPARVVCALLALLLLPAAAVRVTFNATAAGISCSRVQADHARSLQGVSDSRTCAVECAASANCSGYHHSSSGSSQQVCLLADQCQLNRWLGSGQDNASDTNCSVHVREQSSASNDTGWSQLSASVVVGTNFRGSLATDWGASCSSSSSSQTLQLVGASQVASGVGLAGSANSYVRLDTASSALTDFVFGHQASFSIFVKLTRIFMENNVHYVWWSACSGNPSGLVLKEWFGKISFIYKSALLGRILEWTVPSEPIDQDHYHLVSIGVTFTSATQEAGMYFNGTMAPGTLVSNDTYTGQQSPDDHQCLFLGRTPFSSIRCLNGTLHCLLMLRGVASLQQMRLMDQACSL